MSSEFVRRDFGADRVAEVLATLGEYGAERWQREPHRVRLAVLKLAGGSLARLRYTRSRVRSVTTGTYWHLPSILAISGECIILESFHRMRSGALSKMIGSSI